MLRRPLRALAVALAVVAASLGGGAAGAAPSVQASVPGACTNSSGVTVIVDFGHFGGGLEAGCAQHPGNGVAALTAAGFSATVVQPFPAAVCRIDGLPDTTCARMPPASAYWSYWSSTDHRTWTYEGYGAGNRTPPSGSVDGWSFTTGTTPAPPGISPAALTPPATTTTTPTTVAATHAPPNVATSTTSPAKRGDTPVPGATSDKGGSGPPESAAGPPATTAPSSSASSSDAGAASAVAAPEVKPRASVRIADQSGGSGSPWPVIGGVGGAAALGAGAFLVAHRRRAAEAALDQPDPE